MILTPEQCRMARAALKLEVRDLSELADVSPNTIARLERGEAMHPRTQRFVKGALEAAGIAFVADGAVSERGGAGVRLGRAIQSTYGELFEALRTLPHRRQHAAAAYTGTIDLLDRYLKIVADEGRELDAWERLSLNDLLAALDRSDVYSAYHHFLHAITPPDNQSRDYPIGEDSKKEAIPLDLKYFRRCSRFLRSKGFQTNRRNRVPDDTVVPQSPNPRAIK